MINSNFRVGIYIRLSRDDLTKESDSIISQRSLLHQYAEENNYEIIDEYVDDGFTGTNFERPSFKRMIKDIEIGKINMIITKDMSRLGRDYIGTGELVEKYFPSKNIRYIAINDGIDTFLDNTSNDVAPFKAIMNDMYAKDISKKVKTSLHSRMKEGLYVSGRCPFGYRKDPNDKNHLIINHEQADTVRLIFDLALKGHTYHFIATYLTKIKIKTPASYYNFIWNTKCSNSTCISQEKQVWVDTTIKAILTNEIYIGNTVQAKYKKINYKIKKIVKNNPEDYIVVENTHEAIIDKETFYHVQTLLPKNVKRPEKKRFYLLDGLLYCGDCKHRITVRYQNKTGRSYTTCDYYRTYSKYHVCTTHTNNYEVLENEIINVIKNVCDTYLDKDRIKGSLKGIEFKDNSSKIKGEITNLEVINKKLSENLDKSYMDNLKGIIDDEQYARISKLLKQEINANKEKIDNLKAVNANDSTKDNRQIENYINEFLSLENPTRELIINIIEKIEIYDDKTIDIKFTFNKGFIS
ncbi:MAG: recombinase family protein [Bacilli bacterium]|nr:recombinase family protein [Bacilli bacterium]